MRHTDHRSACPKSAGHAHDTCLFVALELSRSTWLIGSSTPGSDVDGVGAWGTTGLFDGTATEPNGGG
jgi:hypothetical protein